MHIVTPPRLAFRRFISPRILHVRTAPVAPAAQAPADPELRALRRRWAQLIRRIYEVDFLACPRCGATMRVIAFITEPKVIGKSLLHFAVDQADGPSVATARRAARRVP
jgi:hypothetical protein